MTDVSTLAGLSPGSVRGKEFRRCTVAEAVMPMI